MVDELDRLAGEVDRIADEVDRIVDEVDRLADEVDRTVGEVSRILTKSTTELTSRRSDREVRPILPLIESSTRRSNPDCMIGFGPEIEPKIRMDTPKCYLGAIRTRKTLEFRPRDQNHPAHVVFV